MSIFTLRSRTRSTDRVLCKADRIWALSSASIFLISFCSFSVRSTSSKSAMLSKSLRTLPFPSLIVRFSAVRPSTAFKMIFWMPRTLFRFVRISLPGISLIITLAETGFCSEENNLRSGFTIVTSANVMSEIASRCCLISKVVAFCHWTSRSKSVVAQFVLSKNAYGFTLEGTRSSSMSKSLIL